MASANLNIAGKNQWMLAHPWPWIGAGFALTLWSWLWTITYGDSASDYRVIVLAVGLLFAGVGVWMRWCDRRTTYVRVGRLPLVTLLSCVFALSSIGIIGLFVLSFIIPDRIPFKSAPLFLLSISAAPLAYFAARRSLKRNGGDSRGGEVEEEIAQAFAAAAVICLIGTFTLSAEESDWDTIRLFLRVAGAVCVYASALVLVSKAVRRIMVSLLIAIHFAGIATAVLAVPPAPWIVQQAWMRLFRPYLEFVYLNNAYHFYAPEPSVSSYLWFRIIYESPDGDKHGMWYKLPKLDDKGRITHTVALEYQRYMSLIEGIGPPAPLPSEYEFNPQKQTWEQRAIYRNRRMVLQPPDQVPVGQGVPTANWIIPFDPSMPPPQQVVIPNDTAKQLLASYARFIAIKFKTPPEAGKENWKFVSVKMYRVVHWIPPVAWFQEKLPPTDPWLYRPFYLGNYGADGTMIDDGDPYLYWMLPSRREFLSDPDSKIFDYCRLHAGDPEWVRDSKSETWRAPTKAEEDPVLPWKLKPDPAKKKPL